MGLFRGKKMTLLFGGAIGAALAYFFDPDRGRGRRTRTRDMAKARMRRAGEEAGRQARWRRGQVSGTIYEATHQVPAQPDVDDKTLAQRVRSELFGDQSVPKGRIDIDVNDGVVVLRGQLDQAKQINDVERRARKIAGVKSVENLLHLPGTPAPNKAEAQRTR